MTAARARTAIAAVVLAVITVAASGYAARTATSTSAGTAVVCERDGHVLRFDAAVTADATRVHKTAVGTPSGDPTRPYTCEVVRAAG